MHIVDIDTIHKSGHGTWTISVLQVAYHPRECTLHFRMYYMGVERDVIGMALYIVRLGRGVFMK